MRFFAPRKTIKTNIPEKPSGPGRLFFRNVAGGNTSLAEGEHHASADAHHFPAEPENITEKSPRAIFHDSSEISPLISISTAELNLISSSMYW